MGKIKTWMSNARDISVPQSLLPCILTIAMVATEPHFSWWLAIIATIGVVCAHMGMNLADDYFDYKKDTTRIRAQVIDEGKKTHMEKCHYLLDGSATVKDLTGAICCFLGVAGLLGLVVVIAQGLRMGWQVSGQIAGVAIGGLLLGLSYSGGPLKLGYRGFGEWVIGIMFGPLLMIGMSLGTCGVVHGNLVLISIAIGLMVTNIGYVHSVMDTRVDSLSNRITFAVLVKSKVAMLIALGCFAFIPFIIVIGGVLCGLLHWSYLFTLVLVPLSIYLIYSTHAFLYNKEISTEPRWWKGPMGDWETYKKYDMDWFLARWLVARNIITFFCLILVIVNIILAIVY